MILAAVAGQCTNIYSLCGGIRRVGNTEKPRRILSLAQMPEQVFLFVNTPLETINHQFVRALLAQIANPTCGIASGLLLDTQRRVLHSGWEKTAHGQLTDRYAGEQFAGSMLSTVRCVHSIEDCFFAVQREALVKAGGVALLSAMRTRELLMRLTQTVRAAGQRIVVTPFALATAGAGSSFRAEAFQAPLIGRPDPAREFDSDFYRITYAAELVPEQATFSHYLAQGYKIGYAPRADFDPAYYRKRYPDVARDGWEPFTHYVQIGRAQGRITRAPRLQSSDWENYFPVPVNAVTDSLSPPPRPVDVIVPVYKGFKETRACLESVLEAVNRTPFSLVIINDCSPDASLEDYVHSLADMPSVEVISHPENVGFVASVNEGMRLHSERDVILLNSDTLVNGDWIDRLARCAYGGKVASVSPFSNNATICSFPKNVVPNAVPPGYTVNSIDALIRRTNFGRYCNLPTTVGFCMYIRRDALNEVGLFDEAAFGQGYGEENDFCMRALLQGWNHRLAADTYVYHAGSVSFGSAIATEQRGMDTVVSRYPRYLDWVGAHIEMDPAKAFRIAAVLHMVAGLAQQSKPGKQSLIRIEHAEGETAPFVIRCDRAGLEFTLALDYRADADILSCMRNYLITSVGPEHLGY
jgi:GT2 family glycosyltransferase